MNQSYTICDIPRFANMTIHDIPRIMREAFGGDFTLAYCSFLDYFYCSPDQQTREAMLVPEPDDALLTREQCCQLAAAAHKLASDYDLTVPEWVHKPEYKMPEPVYAFQVEDEESRNLYEEVTPIEYASRNLFFGSRVLERATKHRLAQFERKGFLKHPAHS